MKPVIAFNDHHFELGQKVSFIRQLPDGTIGDGEAIFLAVHLDQNRRTMAHLKNLEKLPDGRDDIFNTDLLCVNASEDFKAEYERMTEQVKALQTEGNNKISEITKDYNAQVDDCYTALLGDPVEIK